jgi:RNA polymerase sigma factor (sigma-70 family)
VPEPQGSGTQRPFADVVATHEPSPEEHLLARERRQQLAAALARLPERQRTVFMLSHCEGYTSREVSALTRLNESTVRVHLFRAIRRLRRLLTHEGAEQTAGSQGDKRRVNS